jgi:hypothetical protein
MKPHSLADHSLADSDPEAAIQERSDWFTDLVLWLFTYAPVIPLVVYCVAMVLTTLIIILTQLF